MEGNFQFQRRKFQYKGGKTKEILFLNSGSTAYITQNYLTTFGTDYLILGTCSTSDMERVNPGFSRLLKTLKDPRKRELS